MRTVVSCLITGTICTIVGGIIGYKISDYRHEGDIESVKEAFYADKRRVPYARFAKNEQLEDEKKVEETPMDSLGDHTNLMDYYKERPKNTPQKHYMMSDSPSESSGEENIDAPSIIAPDEFMERMNDDGWTHVSLTYFADGVLTDDNLEEVDDADEKIGNDFASHFGEYDDDVVYVRNYLRRCDYEIVRDERDYDDVIVNRPSPVKFT